MCARVINVKKSKTWDVKPADGQPKPAFAVVTFVKSSPQGASRFQKAALGDSEPYVKTYDLRLLYDNHEADDDNGKFSRAKAYEKFCEELPVGAEEPINCYEFSIHDLSNGKYDEIVNADGRTQRHIRPASYSERERAFEQAKANFERRVREKTWKPVQPKREEDDTEGGDDD